MNIESLVTDFMSRVLAGKSYKTKELGSLIENQELGQLLQYDSDGNILWRLGILEDDTFGLVVVNNGVAELFAGKNNDFYGVKLSGNEKDVFDDSNIVISSDRTPIRLQYTSQMNQPDAVNQVFDGFVSYVSTNRNYVIRLPFFLENNIVITGGLIKVLCFDTYYYSGTIRLNGLSVYLNPSWSLAAGSFGQNYMRANIGVGSRLVDSVNPTRDKFEIDYQLSTDDIEKLQVDSWNEIVIQQDTNDTGVTNFGYAQAIIFLDGYVKH